MGVLKDLKSEFSCSVFRARLYVRKCWYDAREKAFASASPQERAQRIAYQAQIDAANSDRPRLPESRIPHVGDPGVSVAPGGKIATTYRGGGEVMTDGSIRRGP